MVGKEKSIIDMTSMFVGRSFKDFPCLALVHHFYDELGVFFPYEYKQYTVYNYLKFYNDQPEQALQLFMEVWGQIGQEVEIADLRKYDLLLVEEKTPKGTNIFIAIYLHKSQVITSNINLGVRVCKLGKNKQVIKARRLL